MNSDRLYTHGPLIVFFLIIQLFGLFILSSYAPVDNIITAENGTNYSMKDYNLPYSLNPPQDVNYKFTLVQLVMSLAFVVLIVLLLMKLHVVKILRFWFFAVSAIASAVTLAVFFSFIAFGSIVALALATVLSYMKVFRPSVISHNIVEFLVYPGIAAILVPLFSIPTIIALFVVISVYDAYAVWHSGIMQRMAKYQIQKVRVFSGLLLPQFLTKKGFVNPFAKPKKKGKGAKIGVALLGGGDIVFPMLLAGVLMYSGFIAYSYAVIIGAAAGLLFLVLRSEKGKFYPAMPFISAGCAVAALLAYAIQFIWV